MTLQPAIAARNGELYLVWSNSTSLVSGSQTANSNILFVSWADGGKTWTAPTIANPVVADDQHVLPSLAIDQDPNDVHVTYYTQHSTGSVASWHAEESPGMFSPNEMVDCPNQRANTLSRSPKRLVCGFM